MSEIRRPSKIEIASSAGILAAGLLATSNFTNENPTNPPISSKEPNKPTIIAPSDKPKPPVLNKKKEPARVIPMPQSIESEGEFTKEDKDKWEQALLAIERAQEKEENIPKFKLDAMGDRHTKFLHSITSKNYEFADEVIINSCLSVGLGDGQLRILLSGRNLENLDAGVKIFEDYLEDILSRPNLGDKEKFLSLIKGGFNETVNELNRKNLKNFDQRYLAAYERIIKKIDEVSTKL